jgi:hypothetical protein
MQTLKIWKSFVMAEQSEIKQYSKKPIKIGLGAFIALLVLAILIWGSLRLKNLAQELKKIDEVSKVNSQQLINLNQILGHALDVQAENATQSPLDVKASLEIFEKLNSLSFHINALKFKINEQTQKIEETKPPTLNKSKLTGVNAEIRWWQKMGNYVFTPIANYFHQMIKVQVLDDAVDTLAMTQASQQMLRQELVVRSLSARTLLLNGMIVPCKNEVQDIKSQIEKNFLPDDTNTQVVIEEIAFILNRLQDLEKNALVINKNTGNQ